GRVSRGGARGEAAVTPREPVGRRDRACRRKARRRARRSGRRPPRDRDDRGPGRGALEGARPALTHRSVEPRSKRCSHICSSPTKSGGFARVRGSAVVLFAVWISRVGWSSITLLAVACNAGPSEHALDGGAT